MPRSIYISTKNFTLVATFFVYFSWCLLSVCEFAMVPGVFTLLSSLEEYVHSTF